MCGGGRKNVILTATTGCVTQHWTTQPPSLVPQAPPPFSPSVCVHNDTQEWMTGSIHHVSGYKVDTRWV